MVILERERERVLFGQKLSLTGYESPDLLCFYTF